MGRGRSRSVATLFFVWTALLTAGAVADAPPQEQALADQAFADGRALLTAGKYDAACAKFAESDRIAPSGGAVFNLADCYERSGKPREAWEKFNDAAGRALRAGLPQYEAAARARADALAPKLRTLTITVRDAANLPGLSVVVDGSPLAKEAWGAPRPTTPGSHRIEVSAPGHVGAGAALTTGDGPASYDVPVLAKLDGPGVVKFPPGAESSPPETRFRGRRTAALVVGGAGVAALAAGAVFGVVALGEKAALDGRCSGGSTDRCPNRADPQLASGAATLSTVAGIATIATVAGALLVAASVVLYVTAPTAPSQAGLAGVRVRVDRGLALAF